MLLWKFTADGGKNYKLLLCFSLLIRRIPTR